MHVCMCTKLMSHNCIHAYTVLTKCASGVFKLDMNFDDGTAIGNGWIFSNFGFCKAIDHIIITTRKHIILQFLHVSNYFIHGPHVFLTHSWHACKNVRNKSRHFRINLHHLPNKVIYILYRKRLITQHCHSMLYWPIFYIYIYI